MAADNVVGDRIDPAVQAAHDELWRRFVDPHGHILDYVNASKGYVLLNGVVACERDAHECLDSIKRGGYEGCVKCQN